MNEHMEIIRFTGDEGVPDGIAITLGDHEWGDEGACLTLDLYTAEDLVGQLRTIRACGVEDSSKRRMSGFHFTPIAITVAGGLMPGIHIQMGSERGNSANFHVHADGKTIKKLQGEIDSLRHDLGLEASVHALD